jgi:taurine dioxygenase
MNVKPDIKTDLTIERLSPTIGAVIHDVDLSKPVSQGLRDAIYQALVDHKVIFLRDQDITTEQHLAFGRLFGDLEIHPFSKNKKGAAEVLPITHNRENKGKENGWHSDVTWRLEPSLGSILRAIQVPDVGGDTLFSDMEAAYDELDDTLKEKIDGLKARHDFPNFRRRLRAEGKDEDYIDELRRKYPNPEHPVVRTHPDTGRKSLYVNIGFTQEILGLEKQESDELLTFLYSRAATPEYQCRFKWKKNSIAFWDNRSCQHYAASDYWPAVRKMERVTIMGDAPV